MCEGNAVSVIFVGVIILVFIAFVIGANVWAINDHKKYLDRIYGDDT